MQHEASYSRTNNCESSYKYLLIIIQNSTLVTRSWTTTKISTCDNHKWRNQNFLASRFDDLFFVRAVVVLIKNMTKAIRST